MMKLNVRYYTLACILLLTHCCSIAGEDIEDSDELPSALSEKCDIPATLSCSTENAIEDSSKGITLDLRAPTYSQGVLKTEFGGVITGPNLRLQAQRIAYTRKIEQEVPVFTIEAEGDLIFEYGKYLFVGERLEFDFLTNTGVIYCGKTMVEPWFFGGDRIHLHADGSYFIENAFATTSQSLITDWEILLETAEIAPDHTLDATNVKFRIFRLPVFWLPRFKANLDTIFDGPIRYSIKWGGNQGHRFGLVYELFSWNHLTAFLRLDYRLKRGLGGGIEANYASEDRKTVFQSINYAARDSSIIHPGQRFRYCFQGLGDTLFYDDQVSMHLSYEKVSDIDMPTDYYDHGLDLDIAAPTELIIRTQQEHSITNLLTRLRINNFQTINQELPTFEKSWHPFTLGDTGIISDSKFKASYLDFAYGNNILFVHDYYSPRVEYAPNYYRPFSFSGINATPEVGGVFVAYGNSPNDTPEYLAVGKFGCSLNTSLSKIYDSCKHVITPYANYDYYSMPTVPPNDHYIFDIDDGWYRLNMLQFGFSQSLFQKEWDGISRPFYTNLYANAFFDTHTFPSTIPKVYADFIYQPLSILRYTLNTAWDFNHNELDHFNFRTEYTFSSDAAIAVEYRHRSPWDWRKIDHTNFIIDSYRSLFELRHSLMSDRRDTLLLHWFYRFHPCWAFEFESRHGWDRQFEPPYNEFEIDLIGTLRSALNLKLSYQHKEDDDRLSFYLSIGINPPDYLKARTAVPCLGF